MFSIYDCVYTTIQRFVVDKIFVSYAQPRQHLFDKEFCKNRTTAFYFKKIWPTYICTLCILIIKQKMMTHFQGQRKQQQYILMQWCEILFGHLESKRLKWNKRTQLYTLFCQNMLNYWQCKKPLSEVKTMSASPADLGG